MAENLDPLLNDPVVAFVKEQLPSVVVEPDTKQQPGVMSRPITSTCHPCRR